jgi:hypothetical protein
MSLVVLSVAADTPLEDYTELKSALTNEIDRDDMVAEYDTFCKLAEGMFNDLIWHPRREGIATLTKTSLETELPVRNALPSDFYGLRARKTIAPYQVPPQVLSTQTTAYSVEGNELVFSQTPPESIEILYWKQIGPLYIQGLNWLLERRPDIYLYGMALFAEQRAKNFEGAQVYRDYVLEQIEVFNRAGEYHRQGGGVRMVPR